MAHRPSWTPVPDEDSYVEVTCWAWDRAQHVYQGSMLPTQVIALGRGEVEVIAAHPYIGDPAVTGVATRRMSGQVAGIVISRTGDEVRWVIDDVHVIGTAEEMGGIARGLTRLVAGEVPSVLWADQADSVQIERATVEDNSDVYVTIFSNRYCVAVRRITMRQAMELADVLRSRI